MKIRNYKTLVRKSHRYLGVFIGLQFLLWTISGLFFSWTDIDEIHGDHLRGERSEINSIEGSIAPAEVQTELLKIEPNAKIISLRIVNVLDTNYFEAVYTSGGKEKSTALFHTKSGEKRNALSKDEAELIARNSLAKDLDVKGTEYLIEKDLSAHHEYREKPLPAWAVSFEHPEHLTVYLSAENGQIQSFRTKNWRVFDFLWMLHTMDFIARDDINNWALRIFSGLSILMIGSGFLWFFMTARKPW